MNKTIENILLLIVLVTTSVFLGIYLTKYLIHIENVHYDGSVEISILGDTHKYEFANK